MDTQLLRTIDNAPTKPTLDASALERWLIARIAVLARQSEDEIDVALPFSRYALDSVATVGLTGDLQDLLGIELPPTLLWDYPAITLLARHLAPSKAAT
jgi:8-amino-7-oxononanoate synthase